VTIIVVALAAVLAFVGPAAAQTVIPADDGGRFYGRAEYLLWWTKDSPQRIPFVTTGFLDRAGTQILMGGNDIDTGRHNGGRLTLGYWLTEDYTWGVEASGFYLPTVTRSHALSSSGAPGSVHLVVPFFDPTRNQEAFTDVSSAGEFSGSAAQRLKSRLWGAEGSVVIGLANPGPWRLDLLGGIRYLNLSEGLSFSTSSPDLPPGPVTVFRTKDEFDANNDFYGGQIGLRGRYLRGRFMADATVKVAVGAMRQHIDVSGSLTTNFFSPPFVQTFGGGIFAQPSNVGSHRRDVIAVVPEAGLNVGFKLTDWATILVGYSFLYVSDVVRPGSQIDRVINPTQSQAISLNYQATLNGVARPTFRFQSSDFWAHGLNAGLAFSF